MLCNGFPNKVSNLQLNTCSAPVSKSKIDEQSLETRIYKRFMIRHERLMNYV